MNKLAVVILAAGEGTRMKSSLPKVLHTVCGKPLVKWVLSAVFAVKPDKVCVIVGHKSLLVRQELKEEKLIFVEQTKQLGTGHAFLQTEKYLKGFDGDILVLCADTPLIKPETLRRLIKKHCSQKNAATVLSCVLDNPFGYGRIVRLASGQVESIVEEKDASAEQKHINEINTGIYCFNSRNVWKAAKSISNRNKKKEYYLTDVISILNKSVGKVGAVSDVKISEVMGINDRLGIAAAEEIVRNRVLERLMMDGVTIVDPKNTYISVEAKIGADTVIYPGTIIEGPTIIGRNCSIGPYTKIKDSFVKDNVEIQYSCVYSSKIYDKVKIGPYSHLRPESILKAGAKVGNFSEVKKSTIGEGSKINHLSYVGDSVFGRGVNVGAGTITCNYDGVEKHKTMVGDRVFIGSNVNLVAPVTVGADVILGAGSTITDNVPAKNLAIARSRQVNKKRKK